jgi:hypothetical protein
VYSRYLRSNLLIVSAFHCISCARRMISPIDKRRHQSCVLSNPPPQVVIGQIYALHRIPQHTARACGQFGRYCFMESAKIDLKVTSL